MTQPANGLLLDLSDPLTGKAKLLPYLFKSHLLAGNAKEITYDIPLTHGHVASDYDKTPPTGGLAGLKSLRSNSQQLLLCFIHQHPADAPQTITVHKPQRPDCSKKTDNADTEY